METEKTVVEYSNQVINALRKLGLSNNTLAVNCSALQEICNHHGQYGKFGYDSEVICDFLLSVKTHRENGVITKNTYNTFTRAARLLEEFVRTGKIEWKCNRKGSKIILSDYYENILCEFIESLSLRKSTIEGMRSMLRPYLAFLKDNDCNDVSEITTNHIRQFIVNSSKTGRTLKTLKCYTKRFHAFLKEKKSVSITYEDILSVPVVFDTKVRAYTGQIEFSQILEHVNESKTIGKRDKAILLLASTTGLRAADIINLRLRDIDWRKFEIRLIQQKTGKALSLPLTTATGEAIKEYILYGRPNAESEYIFLRSRAPYREFSKGVAIIHVLEKYQKFAGIERTPHDGKGMHSLRRGLSRNMLISGVPVTMIAQILGHADIESTKPYLSLDTENLKQCAISLDGIEMSGEVFANE